MPTRPNTINTGMNLNSTMTANSNTVNPIVIVIVVVHNAHNSLFIAAVPFSCCLVPDDLLYLEIIKFNTSIGNDFLQSKTALLNHYYLEVRGFLYIAIIGPQD